MLIVCLSVAIGIGLILGLFGEEDNNTNSSVQETVSQDDIKFDPWTDEWYGQGPWWKKW